MRLRFLLILGLVLGTLPSHQAQAEGKPVRHFLVSCDSTPSVDCIKSITAFSASGESSKATKPARSQEIFGGLFGQADIREEWAFEGFQFEGTAGNRAVPGIIYRPKGSEDCDAARCITGLEELQIGMQASWWNATADEWKKLQVDLSRRGKQELCGPASAPTTCFRNHNFGIPVSFEIVMRMPVEFEPSALVGSVKNLKFTKSAKIEEINGVKYRDLTVKFDPQVLQRPLFQSRSLIQWGPRSMQTLKVMPQTSGFMEVRVLKF